MLERLILQLVCHDLQGTSVLKNLGGAGSLELAPWMHCNGRYTAVRHTLGELLHKRALVVVIQERAEILQEPAL